MTLPVPVFNVFDHYMNEVQWALSSCEDLTRELFKDARYTIKERPDMLYTYQLTIDFVGGRRLMLLIQDEPTGVISTEQKAIDLTLKVIVQIDNKIKQLTDNQEIDWRLEHVIPEDYYL